MSAIIDYYFFGISPFAYLGHKPILELAKKYDATLNYKPVKLMDVWAVSGAAPPAQRPPVRQRYRLLELQRMREWRDAPLNLAPAHFPTDVTLSDSCVVAITQRNEDPGEYLQKAFEAVWVDDADISQEAEVADRLAACGFDPDTIITAARSDSVSKLRDAYTKEAVERDAVGVPAYVVNGEVFWGQDRIEFIARAIETGREAYEAGS